MAYRRLDDQPSLPCFKIECEATRILHGRSAYSQVGIHAAIISRWTQHDAPKALSKCHFAKRPMAFFNC